MKSVMTFITEPTKFIQTSFKHVHYLVSQMITRFQTMTGAKIQKFSMKAVQYRNCVNHRGLNTKISVSHWFFYKNKPQGFENISE